MVLAALSAGFYLTDAARIIAAIGSKLMDYKTENPGEAMFFGSGSKVMVVIRSILLILSTVPAAAGLIYTVQALVRKTCDITPADNDSGYVKERVTGLLACDGDVEDLSSKMEWLIVHDAERREMGINARKSAAKRKLSVVMMDYERLLLESKR